MEIFIFAWFCAFIAIAYTNYRKSKSNKYHSSVNKKSEWDDELHRVSMFDESFDIDKDNTSMLTDIAYRDNSGNIYH